MKIITLGTSHGSPTKNRFNSSTLFETKNGSYLLDAGSPVKSLLIRKNKSFADIKGVFITHMHEDHVGGLPGLIKMTVKKAKNNQHTYIYLPEKSAPDAIKVWLEAMHLTYNRFFTFRITDTGMIYEDDNIKVTAIPTRHLLNKGKSASYSYVIEENKKRILYTGDLSSDFNDFPKVTNNKYFDMCICECQHYKPKTALPVFKKINVGKMVFNHVADKWHGKGEQTLKNYYKSLSYPVSVAHDGDEFTV